jgi:hypothetical protein
MPFLLVTSRINSPLPFIPFPNRAPVPLPLLFPLSLFLSSSLRTLTLDCCCCRRPAELWRRATEVRRWWQLLLVARVWPAHPLEEMQDPWRRRAGCSCICAVVLWRRWRIAIVGNVCASPFICYLFEHVV